MKVLLATDGSASANAGTKFLRSLAERNIVDAIVATVSYDPSRYAVQPWYPEWTEFENKRAETILDEAQLKLQDVCRSVELIHGTGGTVPYLLQQAEKSEVELIVLGATGHSAIGRLLLGSTSDDIASRAKCSVVVVRPDGQPTFAPKHLLLAYDRSVASREAADELMHWSFDSEITVDLHSVVQRPYPFVSEGFLDEPIEVTPEQMAEVEETAERMASQIADHFVHTKSQAVVSDHIGDSIIQAAEEKNSDLIIVGNTGHSLIGELFLGSTSKYVLRHAKCSVWISRHHWKTQDEHVQLGESISSATN